MNKKDRVVIELLRMIKFDIMGVKEFIQLYDQKSKGTAFAHLGEIVAKRFHLMSHLMEKNDWLKKLGEIETKQTQNMLKKKEKRDEKAIAEISKMLEGISPKEEAVDDKRYIG